MSCYNFIFNFVVGIIDNEYLKKRCTSKYIHSNKMYNTENSCNLYLYKGLRSSFFFTSPKITIHNTDQQMILNNQFILSFYIYIKFLCNKSKELLILLMKLQNKIRDMVTVKTFLCLLSNR